MSIENQTPYFSIVIPAHNEEGCIERTCVSIIEEFERQNISDIEILVINDNSSDATEAILQDLSRRYPAILRYLNNTPPHGFGFAVRKGLASYRGECVCVVMADLSDSPQDVAVYYAKMREGYECVFGSRFIKGSKIIDYPQFKLYVNRCANWFIKRLFHLPYNDITNAFKCYRRDVMDGMQPLLSHHFNLTVELPLKAIVRGYNYAVVPISWTNRDVGVSKLKLKEMGSRYLFIVLYVFLERLLSKRDYHRITLAKHSTPVKETEIPAAPSISS